MPGLDHDVHPDTIGSERYDACRTKRRQSGYWAPDVCRKTSPPMTTWHWVEDRSSPECRYDMSLTDSKCSDCPHRGSGEAYDRSIRSKGT